MKHLLTTIAAVGLVGCGKPISKKKEVLKSDIDIKSKSHIPYHSKRYSARKRTIEYGSISDIKLLLNKGLDVNEIDFRGRTVIHYALNSSRSIDVMKLLITSEANLNIANNYGATALDIAIFHNKTEIYDLLRKHGGKTGEELKAEENEL